MLTGFISMLFKAYVEEQAQINALNNLERIKTTSKENVKSYISGKFDMLNFLTLDPSWKEEEKLLVGSKNNNFFERKTTINGLLDYSYKDAEKLNNYRDIIAKGGDINSSFGNCDNPTSFYQLDITKLTDIVNFSIFNPKLFEIDNDYKVNNNLDYNAYKQFKSFNNNYSTDTSFKDLTNPTLTGFYSLGTFMNKFRTTHAGKVMNGVPVYDNLLVPSGPKTLERDNILKSADEVRMIFAYDDIVSDVMETSSRDASVKQENYVKSTSRSGGVRYWYKDSKGRPSVIRPMNFNNYINWYSNYAINPNCSFASERDEKNISLSISRAVENYRKTLKEIDPNFKTDYIKIDAIVGLESATSLSKKLEILFKDKIIVTDMKRINTTLSVRNNVVKCPILESYLENGYKVVVEGEDEEFKRIIEEFYRDIESKRQYDKLVRSNLLASSSNILGPELDFITGEVLDKATGTFTYPNYYFRDILVNNPKTPSDIKNTISKECEEFVMNIKNRSTARGNDAGVKVDVYKIENNGSLEKRKFTLENVGGNGEYNPNINFPSSGTKMTLTGKIMYAPGVEFDTFGNEEKHGYTMSDYEFFSPQRDNNGLGIRDKVIKNKSIVLVKHTIINVNNDDMIDKGYMYEPETNIVIGKFQNDVELDMSLIAEALHPDEIKDSLPRNNNTITYKYYRKPESKLYKKLYIANNGMVLELNCEYFPGKEEGIYMYRGCEEAMFIPVDKFEHFGIFSDRSGAENYNRVIDGYYNSIMDYVVKDNSDYIAYNKSLNEIKKMELERSNLEFRSNNLDKDIEISNIKHNYTIEEMKLEHSQFKERFVKTLALENLQHRNKMLESTIGHNRKMEEEKLKLKELKEKKIVGGMKIISDAMTLGKKGLEVLEDSHPNKRR